MDLIVYPTSSLVSHSNLLLLPGYDPHTVTISNSEGELVPFYIESKDSDPDCVLYTNDNIRLKGSLIQVSGDIAKVKTSDGNIYTTKFKSITEEEARDVYDKCFTDNSKNVTVSYMTNSIKWKSVINIKSLESLLLSLSAVIESSLKDPIEVNNLKLVMTETQRNRYQSYESAAPMAMSAQTQRSYGSQPEDESDLEESYEFNVGKIYLRNTSNIPLLNIKLDHTIVNVIDIKAYSEDAHATESIVFTSPIHLPPSRYNLTHKSKFNTFNMSSFNKGELAILPVTKSQNLRYQLEFLSKDDEKIDDEKVVDDVVKHRQHKHVIQTSTISLKFINSSTEKQVILMKYQNYGKILSIKPEVNRSISTKNKLMWDISVEPGSTEFEIEIKHTQ